MDFIKEFFKRDKFAEHCGITLLEVSKGYAKAKMEITASHINGVGTVQGGAIFTLADLVFAAASNSHGTVAVAINVSISFVKAAKTGTLFAEAKELSINPKIATYVVDVTNEKGDKVAIFNGMVYRKEETLESIVNS